MTPPRPTLGPRPTLKQFGYELRRTAVGAVAARAPKHRMTIEITEEALELLKKMSAYTGRTRTHLMNDLAECAIYDCVEELGSTFEAWSVGQPVVRLTGPRSAVRVYPEDRTDGRTESLQQVGADGVEWDVDYAEAQFIERDAYLSAEASSTQDAVIAEASAVAADADREVL